MYYPEITDKDFYEKIYLKKEFRENEVLVVEPKKKDKSGSSNFELEPHQNFLKNYDKILETTKQLFIVNPCPVILRTQLYLMNVNIDYEQLINKLEISKIMIDNM